MPIARLLEPRFKIIALYPECPFAVGHIYRLSNDALANFYRNYPHLFREVPWYEGRELPEMPKYLKKRVDNVWVFLKPDRHFSSSDGEYNPFGFLASGRFWAYVNTVPLSEEDYLKAK